MENTSKTITSNRLDQSAPTDYQLCSLDPAEFAMRLKMTRAYCDKVMDMINTIKGVWRYYETDLSMRMVDGDTMYILRPSTPLDDSETGSSHVSLFVRQNFWTDSQADVYSSDFVSEFAAMDVVNRSLKN